MIYNERTAIEPLLEGRTVVVRGIGNSMSPRLLSGQLVSVYPVGPKTVLQKGDIVLCKVQGSVYMHLISAVRGEQYQISNNHGHVNGWISRARIYGKVER